jgi:hypothetical protein
MSTIIDNSLNPVIFSTVLISDGNTYESGSNYVTITQITSSGASIIQVRPYYTDLSSSSELPSARFQIDSILSGLNPTASAPGAATFGVNNIANNTGSFVEGVGTLATGFAAHAAGLNTTASGYAAFSMGVETDADGTASFAAGSGSQALGTATVAMGIGTVASSSGQLVVGHYNETKTDINNLFVVGDGTGPLTANRRNIIEVYGGMGASFRGVKIDTAATPTITTTIDGFNIYGRSIFYGGVTQSAGIITIDGDYGGITHNSASYIAETYTSLGQLRGRTLLNYKGIDFNDSNLTSAPSSTHLWTNNANRLFYSSSAIILNDGNTLGTTMTIGTTDANNLQLETNNSTRVFISSSGNVGIGTITPTLATLQIQGNVSASSYTGSLFGTSSWAVNALTASFVNTASTNAFVQGGNSFGTTALLGTNDNQDLQFETSGSVRMTISSSGNVGIGTSTPLSTLTVAGGNVNINSGFAIGGNNLGSFTPFIRYNNTGAGVPSASFGHTTAYMLSDAGGVFGTNDLSFWVGGITQTEIVRIVGSTGFVGIGESSPSAKLEIKGSGTTSATTALRVENSAATARLTILDDGTSAFNTSHLYISASGNVGIGTTNLQAQLHVTNSLLVGATSTYFGAISTNPIQLIAGAANNSIGMRADAIYMYPYGSTTTLHFGFNGNSAWRLINQNTSSFQIYNSTPTNAVLVNISSSGNVGIGNSFTNPSAQLHISGASNSGLFKIDSPAQNNIIYVSGSGNVGIGTGTPSAKLHIDGGTILSGSLYTYGANTDIDSGSFRTIITVATSSYRAAFFDYVLTSGSNARAGTVFSVWQGTSVEYTDTSTNDIGNTSGVNLLVSMSGANIGLFASSSNDNWSMKALARLI